MEGEEEDLQSSTTTATMQANGKNVNVKNQVLLIMSFKDYICPEKRSNKIITIEHGDSFTYNTNPGGAAK